jgi:hypothetical protein
MSIHSPIHNVMIFGDSYSTFETHIPEGYASYYCKEYDADHHPSDVTRVEETWWHQLCEEMNLNLVLNDSWSGSTVCYTGYKGDCSKTSSFIYRMEKLAEEDFYEKNKIDTVFFFGCTNDHWAHAPFGEEMYEGHTHEDLFSVRPAIGYFVGRLRALMPNANIVVLINTGLSAPITSALQNAAEHFGGNALLLSDIDKVDGHPTILGMTQIKDQVKALLIDKE